LVITSPSWLSSVLIFQNGGQPLINTSRIPSKELAPYVVPNDVNVSPTYTGKLDSQRLATFDPKVQSAIMRLHLRREYVSLDHIVDEIKNWSVIEQFFCLEFVYQQQGSYIDRAVSCEPQYVVDTGIRKFRVDFRFSLPDAVMPVLPLILYYVELDSFRWHDRTPQEFAKGKRRMRLLQRKGQAAYGFAGSEVWHNAMACVFEVVGAMEAALIERRRMARLVTFAASSHVRL
jgi:hypothetical protein